MYVDLVFSYVMQYYTDKIKKELQKLAVQKRERALKGMPDSFCQVFSSLPALFQFNHPKLPGYLNDVDSQTSINSIIGVSHYQCDDAVFSLLKDVFGFESDSEIDDLIHSASNEPLIAALYSMGSTCSIGQAISSDLDIWVCLDKEISPDQRNILQQKCRLIEQWARAQNIDLTLFVVDVNRFKQQHHECLMGENCGSAQHMLLLEEFYRTASLLAGKLLLWFVVPSDFIINGIDYGSYESCIDALVAEGHIHHDDWIDFGSLINLSAQEYFGASLWLLYKSIDSPFKAVLKTLLLEAYSWRYPVNHSIAFQMKVHVQKGDMTHKYYDPYYMLLQDVTTYLTAIKDPQRLELVRICFYLKVGEKLSIKTNHMSWRRVMLTKLVNEWHWDEEKLARLDYCEHWKIEQVREFHEILLHTMMTGYRSLLNFGRRNNLDSVISPRDLAVLTRKLYTAFEVLPGKVSVINAKISDNLAENNITFIHVKEDRINRAGWYLYNQSPKLHEIVGHQYLEYSKYLVKLVAWSYFNGLLSDHTTLFYRDAGNYDNSKINQLVSDLRSYFPVSIPAATEDALYGPCEIRHLAIMLNLEDDPTATLSADDLDGSGFSSNVLNYGEKELSLVGSIDLLYRNSWNEIRVLHFSGELCVLDAIKTLLNRMHKDADLPNSIEIFSYSKHLKYEIKQQMRALMDECVDLRLSTTQNNQSQFRPLRINGSSWYLFFERLGVTIHQFDNAMDFYGAISNNKVQGRALNMLDETSELPKEIDSVACEGIIQFFFEDVESGFDLYILNEYNQIEIYRGCNGNKENMVKDVNSFYALSDDRFTFTTSSSVNFNLPQFYLIAHNQNGEREVISYN